jgi:hypothetical protein
MKGELMRKAVIPAFLLVFGALVLSVTVFGEPIAGASIPFSNVIVGNTTTNPVPVDVQNTDGAGNLKVHEQGTANVSVQGTPNVNVTNTSVPVHETGTPNVNVTNTTVPVHEQGTANVNITNGSLPVTLGQPAAISDGGGHLFMDFNTNASPGQVTASAVVVHMSAGVSELDLYTNGGGTAASFLGPSNGGTGTISLAFSRPISFNEVQCFGGLTGDTCTVSWVGNS